MATSPPAQRRRGRPPKGTRGDTRQELLDAALRLFAQQGYAATTVRQIADEVGIRDSAIYAHFESKSELLDALVQEAGPSSVDDLGFDFARLSERSPREVLPEFFERLVAAWDRPRSRQLISLLAREGLEGTAEVVGDVQDRFAPHVRSWAEDGQLRGDVPADRLVWELIMPLAAIRIFHLNARASPARRREGRRVAAEHVDYFLVTAATP